MDPLGALPPIIDPHMHIWDTETPVSHGGPGHSAAILGACVLPFPFTAATRPASLVLLGSITGTWPTCVPTDYATAWQAPLRLSSACVRAQRWDAIDLASAECVFVEALSDDPVRETAWVARCAADDPRIAGASTAPDRRAAGEC
jgi:hypothetical protein